MTEAIIVALISGGLALTGTVLTCLATARKTERDSAVRQAVLETKIGTLADEVRQHNNFARRMPVVEEQIKVIHHRIDELRRAGAHDRIR